MTMLNKLKQELRKHATPERKKANEWFFKTGSGQYGEGDIFLGLRVPDIRTVVRQFSSLTLEGISKLLRSSIHEERLCGVFILVNLYKKSKSIEGKRKLYLFYLDNVAGINNWDLVDSSAPHVVGSYLFQNGDYSLFYDWIIEVDLWKRRIALLATQYFIRQGQYQQTLELAEKVLGDKEDLIHKASGWMLREVGKKDQLVLETFLQKHYKTMPRTMLRYAIEKFDKETRHNYLRGQV